ncbi:MAG: 3,5-nucleoside bisphosphate phosphatase [Thermotogota bacterium]|nr:3,5-nucleoside bisphosphate phosphatase [Thermotogota bacterium]
MLLDCHLHSTCSDGSYTPEQLAFVYSQLGYSFVVLTDHDTVAGLRPFAQTLRQYGVKTTTGVEITANFHGGELHILAYRIDTENTSLLELLEQIQKARIERAHEILSMLEKLGYPLTIEEVKLHMTGQVLGRPHIAKAMVTRGYIKTVRDAFTPDFLADQGKAFVPPSGPEADKVIKTIKQAGGIAVLAHPGIFVDENGRMGITSKQFIELCDMGIDGVEVFHPKHSSNDIWEYLRLCREFGLFVSCGSDFHEGEIVRISGYVPSELWGELKRCSEVLSLV